MTIGDAPSMRSRCALAAAVAGLVTMLSWAARADTAICPNGAEVRQESYCAFFAQFRPEGAAEDVRISEQLATDPGKPLRSIAIIVGNDKYPNMDGADLPPAAHDIENLRRFLVDDQKFDEVIILRNGDATKDTIRYFLTDYLSDRAELYRGRTRVLFAYSGHGAPQIDNSPPALVLSGATSQTDTANRYPLDELNAALTHIAGENYQVLALINACFGGSLLGIAQGGGNIFDPSSYGAHALTAGAPNELVWSLGTSGSGSIFFDDLINGIRSGAADPDYHITLVDSSGHAIKVPIPIVRLGRLLGYITQEVEDLGLNPDTGKRYSVPWFGPISPIGKVSLGGFFFLVPENKLADAGESAPESALVSNAEGKRIAFGASFTLPTGAVSSIVGHPEIKVFNSPEQYLIHGIDVSQYNAVDWPKLGKSGIRFVYIRGTGIRGTDQKFEQNWPAAKAAGLRRGAYHYFSYCQSAASQFDRIREAIRPEPGDLPIAVDIWRWPPTSPSDEVACARQLGPKQAAASILSLVAMLHKEYGKVPLVYGNRDVFSKLLTQRGPDYVVWLGDHNVPAEVHLSGKEPWTIWQYSDTSTVPGVKGKIDQNVFFGTPGQFDAFIAGQGKIAVDAATQ